MRMFKHPGPSTLIAIFLTLLLIISYSTPSQLFSQQQGAPVSAVQAHDSTGTEATKEPLIQPSFGNYLASLKYVFSNRSNLYYLAIGSATALFMWPRDVDISESFKQEKSFKMFDSQVANRFGGFIPLFTASAFTHTLGRLIKNDNLANTGLYLIESMTTTSILTISTKVLSRRTRPNGEDNRSFFSGHTSGIFTVASVLDRRYGYKAGIPAYLVASYVGISRIKLQKHFPTDVIAGATLGIIIGRSFIPSRNQNESFAILPFLDGKFAGLTLLLAY